jgi:hypothetical protein
VAAVPKVPPHIFKKKVALNTQNMYTYTKAHSSLVFCSPLLVVYLQTTHEFQFLELSEIGVNLHRKENEASFLSVFPSKILFNQVNKLVSIMKFWGLTPYV